MAVTELVGLSLGLAMDSTAVAATRGLAADRLPARDVLRASLLFGGAHVLMPTLGWLAGGRVVAVAAAYDHWIAFGLLAALGLKMLVEARRGPDAPDPRAAPDRAPFAWAALAPLALATSLDALAAGLTLPMLGLGLAPSVACIGLTNAALTALGAFAGRLAGRRLGPGLEAVGGLVLIGIGLKILYEHLRAGPP